MNQANLMNLFKIVENLISSQIDADEEGFKVSNCRLKNLDWKNGDERAFEVTTYSFCCVRKILIVLERI